MDKIFDFNIKNVIGPVLWVIGIVLGFILLGFISSIFNRGRVEDIFLNYDKNDYNESIASVQNNKLSIEKDTIELSFVLNTSEDFYEASFPMINNKGKNIVLKKIDLSGLSINQMATMNFEIVYDDKVCDKFSCKVNKTLKKDDTVNVVIRARNQKDEVPLEEKEVNVKIKFNYKYA